MSATIHARDAAPAPRLARPARPAQPRRASPFPWAPPAPPRLAPGEALLWTASPPFAAIAMRLYHLRLVALYGVALTMADLVQAKLKGLTLWPALEAAIPGTLTTLGALAIFAALAWASARTTRYTLTDRRLVLQCGLGLPKTVTLPLTRIAGVAVRTRDDGTGDIVVTPEPGSKLAYLKLWPFARPWHLNRPQPMLRDAPMAGYAATLLTRQIQAAKASASQRLDHPAPSDHPVPASVERAL